MAIKVQRIQAFQDEKGNLYQPIDKTEAGLRAEDVLSVQNETTGQFFLAKRYLPYPPAPDAS